MAVEIMTYAEEVDTLLERLPAGANLTRRLYNWSVDWPSRKSVIGIERDKDKLVALQRAVRRMENE